MYSVRDIPKFRDRANWSRDTVQPMRKRGFAYQNINQVLQNFSQWRTEANRALLFRFPLKQTLTVLVEVSHHFKENI